MRIKEELIQTPPIRMREDMKDNIWKSAKEYGSGVFQSEIRDLIEKGLIVRRFSISELKIIAKRENKQSIL